MKNNEEFDEQTALAFFTDYLDEQKWKYHRCDDPSIIFSGYDGTNGLLDFKVFARKRSAGIYLLGVNSYISNKASPNRRLACAELLTRINYQLAVGCFEMNYDEGDIRFQTSLMIPPGDITPGIIEYLVCSNLSIVEQHFNEIMVVLYSDITPKEALNPQEKKSEKTPEPRFEMN